ncbi:MAG: dTDP-4-dehydrorhamnose reductase [Flavobacteriales bacterium]|nr:dTDP-4-dehydrorhamnose reductase [Flavobacteriales bacterium]
MEEKTILITGAGGQLGRELYRHAASFPDLSFVFADHKTLDTTVESWVHKMISELRPAAVVNCAAYTNVERAEDDPENAMLTNAAAAGFVADACHKNNALMVHISTDYVFDGKGHRPYTENDQVNPLSVYGESKLEGERLVDGRCERSIIIRTSWLYSATGHNFFRTMLRLAKERGELRVVSDQIASPTYAGDFAKDILAMLQKVIVRTEHIEYGTYHYTQLGEASWYDFAKEIILQSDMDVPVHAVKTGEFPTRAIRPAYSKLDCTKWLNVTGLPLNTWQTGLSACFEEYHEQEHRQ